MRQGERNEGSRSLYSPSDLAGEEIQSPCTPDSQKAAGRNLTCLPLVPPRFEPSRSLGRGSVQVSVFPLPNSPRSSDFSPHRRGKDEGGEEGGTSPGKRTCAQRARRGRLELVRGAFDQHSALARWRPKARGRRECGRISVDRRTRRVAPAVHHFPTLPGTPH